MDRRPARPPNPTRLSYPRTHNTKHNTTKTTAVDLLRDPEALAAMGDEMKADVASKIERYVLLLCLG